jgi:hypothetical protein
MKQTADNRWRALIEYEGKRWYVDLTTPGAFKVRIEDNGQWRMATSDDANLMDVLNEGKVISREPLTF